MDVEPIRLDPDPYAPFRLSQGFRVGDLLFVSGQAAIDEHGEVVGEGDFDVQAEQTFRNLERVLAAGGSGLDRIVKVTIFLSSREHVADYRRIRQEVLQGRKIGVTTIITGIFDERWLLEIEAMAAA